MSKPRILFSAGDTSGDLHAARLAEEILRRRPDAEMHALGGPALRAVGIPLLHPLADNPVMGFSAVFARLGSFLDLLARTEEWLRRARPDALVLVDYPGFNGNLAALAHRLGIPTCYYICPQYWGWAPWRARRLAAQVDRGLVIFPFEVSFWQQYGMNARYVGHPVADRLAPPGTDPGLEERRGVALLPGSRRREVDQHFPWLLDVAERLSQEDVTFLTTHPRADVREQMAQAARQRGVDLEIRTGPLTEVLSQARLAVVGSGTATLEAALAGVPSVVVYKIQPWMRWAAPFLLSSPFIAQPNLLAGHEVVPEFLATDHPGEPLHQTVRELLGPTATRLRCLRDLEDLQARYLQSGAAARAAEEVLDLAERGPSLHSASGLTGSAPSEDRSQAPEIAGTAGE